MTTETTDKALSTADLAAAAEKPTTPSLANRRPTNGTPAIGTNGSMVMDRVDDRLAPLFSSEVATKFRAQWSEVQSSFVDDPKLAVRHGDELVAQVMKSLAESFSSERARLEGQLERPDEASTENLRVALRRYRSFFERLLKL